MFLVTGKWERCGSLRENECVLIQRELILCTEKLVLKPQWAPWESRGGTASPWGRLRTFSAEVSNGYKMGLTLGLEF